MTNRNMRKSKVLTVVEEKQDSRMMEVVVMSREESLFEAMDGTYTEVDGIFYPNISFLQERMISGQISPPYKNGTVLYYGTGSK